MVTIGGTKGASLKQATGATFWQRHSICSELRTMATANGRERWRTKISDVSLGKLLSLVQELERLAAYGGKVIFRPELTRKGIKEADALRGLAHARIIKEEIEPFFAQLKFPFARNKGEAAAVMSSIGEALGKMLADEPEAADAGGEALLGIILERKFKEKLKGVFIGQLEMVDPAAKTFQDKLAALSPSIRNYYYLKALELIGMSARYPGIASQQRERIRAELSSILSYASVEQLNALGSEKAKVALFFLFIFGQNEPVGPRYSYFHHLIERHQAPADLVEEYRGLDLEERLNLAALKGSVLVNKRKSSLPLPDDRLYDPQKVIVAIDNGAITKLIHIVRAGRKREFFS